MTLRRRECAETAAELDAAIDWYAEKRRLLAVEFLGAVEAGVTHILEWPDSAADVLKDRADQAAF